jgi:molybdenum cofactor cytidylyltransferase
MGRPKQVLDLGGRPVISACLEGIVGAGIDEIVVVVGPDAGEIRAVAESFPVKVAVNAEKESDMAHSVRVGLRQVSVEASGVLVCLCDHPLVRPETMALLCAHHLQGEGDIIIPRFGVLRGHPTLFARSILKEMGPRDTLRDVIERHGDAARFLDVDDEGTVLDMDTWEDYREMVRRYRAVNGR